MKQNKERNMQSQNEVKLNWNNTKWNQKKEIKKTNKERKKNRKNETEIVRVFMDVEKQEIKVEGSCDIKPTPAKWTTSTAVFWHDKSAV
jgi:hypothetical protein